MRIRNLVLAGLVASFAASNHQARAQQDASPDRFFSSADERVISALAQKKNGVVIVDASINNAVCHSMRVAITRKVGDKWETLSRFSSDVSVAGQLKHGAILILAPGEYAIASVNCRHFSFGTRLVGPHARFRVNAGELVNVGRLMLSYRLDIDKPLFSKTTGTMHRSVEALGAEARADVRQRLPKSFAKAVTRPMVIIGSAESALTRR